MEEVKINQVNDDAIKTLENALEKAKTGEIRSVGIAWVTSDNSIGGDHWYSYQRSYNKYQEKNPQRFEIHTLSPFID